MSRKIIFILILLMSAALIGLIGVQAYWIRNAIEVKQQQFNQLVNRSLLNVAQEIQKNETVTHILNEVNPATRLSPQDQTNNVKVVIEKQQGYSRSVVSRRGDDYYVRTTGKARNGSEVRFIPIDSLNPLSLFNEFTFDTLIPAPPMAPDEQELRTEVYQAMNNKMVFVENIVDKMIRVEPNIRERIKPAMMDKMVRDELLSHGLQLGFEYAVHDNRNAMVYHSPLFDSTFIGQRYVTRLFPDDVMSKPHYLSIYFPREQKFINKSVSLMGYTSGVLTLVITLSFALTLYIILRQKKLSEIKNDFVNNMTHELKTPISTISLASQMLNDPSIPIESKNIAHISSIIQNESKRLGFQVEKVLQMAIFDKGKINLKVRQLDMHELIGGIITNFNIQIKRRNGIIRQAFDAERCKVALDEVHFTNVIVNLLDNAVKYCNSEPEILVSTRNHKNCLIMSIKDNGIGIPKDHQKRIFEKFYRVPTGNIHTVKGFGLGLSYVKMIVEGHGGLVSLESEPGKGTTFDISLPLIKET